MKSTVEQINPVQYRVNVEIPADEVNAAFDNAYRKLQKKAKIQGFRPGKAPLGIVKKLYGTQVTGEVHENLINKHLFSALDQQSIRPIASPMVETQTRPLAGDGYNFSAVVDVMPQLDFDDYKGIAVTVPSYVVKDETVEREIYTLRRRQARTRAVDAGTKAENGLLAQISHTATLDGKALPGMDVKDMTVHLGNKELFEGLETEILGMGIGETKSAVVTLPDTYGDADLASKAVNFNLTLVDLKHLDIPALDDEFAKDLDVESADVLTKDVRTHLDGRAKDMERQRLESDLLDKLLELHPFEVPPAMVDQVIDSMIQEQQHPSDDARNKALKDAELRASYLATAKRRTQNTLLLWHIVQKEKLQVTEDEVGGRLEQVLGSMGGVGGADPKTLVQIKKNLEPRIRENLIFEKAMDFLIDNAQVERTPTDI